MNHCLRRLSYLAIVLVISVVSSAQERDQKKAVWVEMDGVTVPLPPKEHPRVFVRSEEIPALRAKMQTKDGKKILRKLTEASQPRTAEEEAAEKDRGFRYYFAVNFFYKPQGGRKYDYQTVNSDFSFTFYDSRHLYSR